jgi:hypothetical protein
MKGLQVGGQTRSLLHSQPQLLGVPEICAEWLILAALARGPKWTPCTIGRADDGGPGAMDIPRNRLSVPGST